MGTSNKLYKLISDFLNKKLDGKEFEYQFSNIYDFTNDEFELNDTTYLVKIREYLERYSPIKEDIKNHPEYYIDDEELRQKIRALGW